MRRCRPLEMTMLRVVLKWFAAGLAAGLLTMILPVRADTEKSGPR
jgi:hypothetical protein